MSDIYYRYCMTPTQYLIPFDLLFTYIVDELLEHDCPASDLLYIYNPYYMSLNLLK